MIIKCTALRFWRQAVFLAVALCACLPLRAEMTNIDAAELARLAAAGVTVVDVRRVDEWRETGVISGSRRLTFVDAQGRVDPQWLEKMKALASPDQPVALICRTGGRSAAAARQLDEAGYKKVYNVQGGITAWIKAGLPLTPLDGGEGRK